MLPFLVVNELKTGGGEAGSFSLALEKGERERGGEEKGEKRREKEKRKGKDYEVMGRAPATF